MVLVKLLFTEKLLRHEWVDGCVYINPDVIADLLETGLFGL